MQIATPQASPQLPLAHYRFKFRAIDTVRLPGYAGSAWRGVFGRSLKKLVSWPRLNRHCLGNA